MAILVDLGEEDGDHQTPEPHPTYVNADNPTTSLAAIHLDEPSPPRPPPSLTSLAAPYPVIYSIASNLDHNDLSSLANTCKLMRETMLQYRKNLLGASLVCSWSSTEAKEKVALQATGRKVLCVRDLVDRCGTCGEPACRTLLYHEKLQSIEYLYCTHFQPPFRPPNSIKVWVEECPSPTHSSLRTDTTHRTTKPITCSMELFNGGWAYQDVTTGYIYRPPPESCIGATADWWTNLASDPNEGGFITYPTSTTTNTDVIEPAGARCISQSWAKWARMAGKGQDARGIGVALKKFYQVSFMSTRDMIAINAELNLAKMHGLLEEERGGVVRGWCVWCEGVVLARGEEEEEAWLGCA
ncbi:hypothetical protein BGX38DRAFT_1265568 [Terfezia claveryi]|nr:hypothetical protein BGX38DRAFT_1265568 [Terfezia claveryi]